MNKKPLTKSYIRSRTVITDAGCWEWSGAKHKTGYGELRRDKKRILAHRLSFFLWNGYWPEVCRHSCDNRVCVNPGHLEDGTMADNNRDRDLRGRGRWLTNEEHGRAKFTNDQVGEVFSLRLSGLTQQKIADRMGMAQSHVSRILRGENRVKS
jgi:hypothetical protein